MVKSRYSTKNISNNFLTFDLLTPTEKQRGIMGFKNDITCITGDPGTGKSFLALYYALEQLANRSCEKIILTKPLVEVGKSMGFLPGTEDDKTKAYTTSFYEIIENILGRDQFKMLINSKKICFEPINFCRGMTYANNIIIADECQNATLHELVTFATRLSDTSKLIMLGDVWQSDIRNSGFEPFTKIFASVVKNIHLDESFQMRHKLITDMYKLYKSHLENGKP
jgi:phosphate starvation-inducible PhoH-like protein